MTNPSAASPSSARAALAAAALALVLCALPAPARAQPASRPLGFVGTLSVAGGGEAGLSEDEGGAGVFELEAALGRQLRSGFRPELGVALGTSQGGHVALRPGLRYAPSGFPFQLRAALDLSNARKDFGVRWLLVGGAYEVRMTDELGLFAGGDVGLPLSTASGFPFLLRAGASLRF